MLICFTLPLVPLRALSEDIYIPVAIAVGATFAITVALAILIKLCCCLRRCARSDAKCKNHHRYQPIVQQQQQPQNEVPFCAANSAAGLLQSQFPSGQSEPPVVPPPRLTTVNAPNPFVVSQSDATAATISTQVNVQHSLNAAEGPSVSDASLASVAKTEANQSSFSAETQPNMYI